MKTVQVLLASFFIQGCVYCNTEQPYCTEMLGSIRVEKGGAVDIPCHFAFGSYNNLKQVRVSWRQAVGGKCARNPFIYNHTENWTHKNYTGRISMAGDPQTDRAVTLRITDLNEKDGPMFCCRISLQFNGEKQPEEWQNIYGTYIRFKDQLSIEQPDVVPAVLGEDISIPCAIHNPSGPIEEIIWRRGASETCFENGELLKWRKWNKAEKNGKSVQKFQDHLSLHIKKVTPSDSAQYCCEVTKPSARNLSPAHGTQVVIADSSVNDPQFTINQSPIKSANEEESVNIGCSYTEPPSQNLLWRGVFWRVGGPAGPFAYHPSDLMVHPNYKGRTQLTGLANLQIKGVGATDNTTYYCFVMLKFCTGNNKTISALRYGPGTQLLVVTNPTGGYTTHTTETPTSPPRGTTPTNDLRQQSGYTTHTTETPTSMQRGTTTTLDLLQLPVILPATGAVLAVIIFFLIVLIVLKKKGVICKKKTSVKSSSENQVPRAPSSRESHMEMPNISSSDVAANQEEVGGTVYAHLNIETLQKGGGKRNKEDNDSQVLYAAVRPSTDQVIYATVQN